MVTGKAALFLNTILNLLLAFDATSAVAVKLITVVSLKLILVLVLVKLSLSCACKPGALKFCGTIFH